MFRLFQFLCALLLLAPLSAAIDKTIPLRLQPDAEAPAVTQIVATEKVLLDAAPVEAEGRWQRLQLTLPLEGYVPTGALSKNFKIAAPTPVHFLPAANSSELCRIEPGDPYELSRAEENWSRITFKKTLPAYFREDVLPTVSKTQAPAEITAPEPPPLELPVTPPAGESRTPTVRFDPEAGVGTRRPNELPPENVVWKSTPRSPAPIRGPGPQAVDPIPTAPRLPDGIMVGAGDTQAREATTVEAPPADTPMRLLTGILVRKIHAEGPGYPIRLESPEGRLIAYVDLSELFINDLSAFLEQRVFLRGPIIPLSEGDNRLVVFARDLRLAE